MAALPDPAALAWPRTRAGARHLMAHAAIRELAVLVHPLAAECLGGRAVPFRATYFDKSPQTNWLVPWHQDTALPLETRHDHSGWGPWSIKDGVHYAHAPAWALERVVALRLHLDDSTAGNGPLRVIPGSHRWGVFSDDEVAALAVRHPAVDCLVPMGGVVRMSPLAIHSSAKVWNGRPRRVIHFEFADALDLAPGVRLAIC